MADFDGDGRLDLVLSNNNAAATLYRNRWRSNGDWLQLSLEGSKSNRDAVGAVVKIEIRAGGEDRTLTRVVEAGSGYASQSMASIHFGLGRGRISSLRVAWPSGGAQQFDAADLEAVGGVNQALALREGGALEKRVPTLITMATDRDETVRR